MLLRVIYAWFEFLEKHFNAKAVEINGIYKVVPILCENCYFKYTAKTKNCSTPNSVGCPHWKHKEAK